jgi:hypothetical protein
MCRCTSCRQTGDVGTAELEPSRSVNELMNGSWTPPDRTRDELKTLDSCLDELEMANERGVSTVSEGLGAQLGEHVPAVAAGVPIRQAIEHVFRAQEHLLKRLRSRDGRLRSEAILQSLTDPGGRTQGVRGDHVADSTAVLASPEQPQSPRDLANIRSVGQLAQLQNVIRQTRDMIRYVNNARDAALLVRRANGIEKLVDEALKSCQVLEEEQFELKQEVAEAHLRTQRRAGELLVELDKNSGGRPAQTPRRMRGDSGRPRSRRLPTLRELGISPSDSYRWQLIASLSLEGFETCIANTRVARRELTTSRVLALAKRLRRGSNPDVAEERLNALVRYEQESAHIWSLVSLDPTEVASAMDAGRCRQELDALMRWRAWFDALEQALLA